MRDLLRETRAFLSHERHRLETMYGVRSIAIFGSVARGDAVQGSDLDILVDMRSPSFDRYMDLKFELEDQLQVPVDLILSDALKDRLRLAIEREAVYV